MDTTSLGFESLHNIMERYCISLADRIVETAPKTINGNYKPHYSVIQEKLVGSLQRMGVVLIEEYPIKPFFADIFIPSDNVVIECDGEAFHKDKEKDKRRDDYMKDLGLRVFRFTGKEIKQDTNGVASNIICNLSGSYPEHEKYLKIQEEKLIEKARLEELNLYSECEDI